jgi:asparagine synthetase B (glutamine-hydrolysing)
MPNLAGIFDMRADPAAIRPVLDRLDGVLAVRGVDYTSRRWCDKRFGAVNLLNGICGNLDQPVVQDNLVAFLDGEVANLRELWIDRKGSDGALPTPARACLELYLQHGDDFVMLLNGQFNILIYDQTGVKIFNDRLAYRPLHYSCVDGLASFAIEKKALFSVSRRTPSFDALGTLEFLTFGHCLADRTIFSGVKVMPQGSVLEIRDGDARVRPYWRLSYAKRPARTPLAQAAIELGVRLCKATERRAPNGRAYGILLSGGLDSRAVAGSLARIGHHVTSFTFGSDQSPDLKYGREIAHELNFEHERLCYDRVSLTELLPQVVWRTEGSVPFNVPLSIAHHRVIRKGADVVFNGHFGDALTGGHLLPGHFLSRNPVQLAEHILAKRSIVPLPTLRTLCRPSFLLDTYSEMVRDLNGSVVALDEERLPLAYNIWDMTVRQPRFTFSSPAVDRYVVEQVTPFTDNEVVEWMLGLPRRHLVGQAAYKRMIVNSFPEISRVPWARTGTAVPTNSALDIAQQVRIFLSKRAGRLAGTTRRSLDPRVEGLRARCEGLLGASFLSEFFERDAVQSMVLDTMSGGCSPTVLYQFLTLDECARLFHDGGPPDPPPETWPNL